MRSRQWHAEDGASSAEYAILAAAIAALITFIVFALGQTVSDSLEESCTEVTNGQGDC